MSSDTPTDDSYTRTELAPILGHLEAVAQLVGRISDEVGQKPLPSAMPIIEKHRAQVYAAVSALGLAVEELSNSDQDARRIDEARRLVTETLRSWSTSSPFFFRSMRGYRLFDFFELVEHIRRQQASGADVPAMVFEDFYLHTVNVESLRNRLDLLGARLRDEVIQRQARGFGPLRIFSLQYTGGAEFERLAQAPPGAAGVYLTCLEESATAVRHALQTYGRAFAGRFVSVLADPERWLSSPTCPRGTACIVSGLSVFESRDDASVVRMLRGMHSLLRRGGILVMGSAAPGSPRSEQVLRELSLGMPWRPRSEDAWRALLAQTPFSADDVAFEHEPLGASLVFRVQREA
jgi:hypothetical protein